MGTQDSWGEETRSGVLRRVGKDQVEASLTNVSVHGFSQFQWEDRTEEVSPQQLLSWSNPPPRKGESQVVLVDGSRLVLAESWLGDAVFQMDEEAVHANTKTFGKISFPRELLRAVLIHPHVSAWDKEQIWKELLMPDQPSDRLLLTSGDVIQGNWQGVDEKIRFETGKDLRTLEFLWKKKVVAAIQGQSPALSHTPQIEIGFADGSLLKVASLVLNPEQLRIQLTSGIELNGTGIRDVVYLRSLAAETQYLSDIQSVSYRHVPYLEIPWELQRDKNVLGDPLQVQGKLYRKGLGVHSACRLTYELSRFDRKFNRFAASVAIDDAAGNRGSVVFRVYLKVGDQWQPAYKSPVVRGGDSPLQVSVELGTASHLALLTDFADRGDERDYANWLDARLE